VIALDLPFRGARTYVHGTDIFTGISEQSEALTGSPDAFVSSLSFHAKSLRQCGIGIGAPPPDELVTAQFAITLPFGPQVVDGWVVQTDQVPAARVEYDEADVVATAQITAAPMMISLRPASSYTSIQVLVAAMKELCLAANPLAHGRWMFGRLDLEQALPQAMPRLEVELTRLFKDRYAVGRVLAGDRAIGTIRFISEP
jgi:hypothetical protein